MTPLIIHTQNETYAHVKSVICMYVTDYKMTVFKAIVFVVYSSPNGWRQLRTSSVRRGWPRMWKQHAVCSNNIRT